MSRSKALAAIVVVLAITLNVIATPADNNRPATKKPSTQPDSAEKDYKAELPRIPPKEPAEALNSFKLRPGFSIELVAAEPLVRDPVAMDFDENGRMFVVELPEYNQYAVTEERKHHGVVRLLEDTDGDGRIDKSSIFAEGLSYPTAVACYDGGIFVGAAPDLLYLKDTTGDGKADLHKVILTGFGRDKAGEAMLNSFRYGFDNRFHVSTSLAGGDVRAVGDKNQKTVSVRGRGLIFDPRTLRFELTSGGGQHGMSMDNWGRKFVCSNSNPAQTLMYDDRYLARNPYLQAPAAAVNIAPGGKFTKLFRISPVEPWRKLRTRLRSKGIVRGSDEGGKPSGFFTGATGITIYRGDAWPAEYRGNLIVGDVSNNIVYRATVAPDGLGVVARRADLGAEFLASSDIWFRPVQFAHAPDGTLYLLDMYRELIEGAAFLPPQILKHLDPSSGTDRGRIYRIVPNGFKQPPLPRLGKAGTDELVALLEHRNGWHRDTASRLLYQRQDPSAVKLIRKLLAGSKLPEGRLHALYALDGLQTLQMADVLAALDDPDSHVRVHAVRLSERFAADSPAIRIAWNRLVDDVNPQVRFQLAFSLGAIEGNARNRALSRLLLRDGGDRWMQLAALSSLGQGAGEVFRLLIADNKFRATDHGRKFLKTLSAQIGDANRPNDLAAVMKSLDALAATEKSLVQSLVSSLVSKQPLSARTQFNKAAGGKAGAILEELLEDAGKTAFDESRKLTDRVSAIHTLGLADFKQLAGPFRNLLQLRQPQPIQTAALDTLAKFDHPQVATLLLDAWPGFSPKLRARATETLFSRPEWIMAFLNAIESGTVGRGEIDPARVKLLAVHPDKTIRSRVGKLFTETTIARRKDVVASYQSALQLQGNAAAGKVHFKKVCSACHRLEGVGTAVGADLSAIRDRGSQAVLLNILDPNRDVKPQFLNYVLIDTEGRISTGMISAESANSITLRRADGTNVTVLRIKIEELKSSGLSFMPEGLEKQLDVQAMADVLAYLNSIQ